MPNSTYTSRKSTIVHVIGMFCPETEFYVEIEGFA